MPTSKLTDRLVKSTTLPEGRSDLLIWDTEVKGLALRVRPGGKSFFLGYRPYGKGRLANMKRIKLGDASDLGASLARTRGRALKARIAEGYDPLAARKADNEFMTLDKAISEYQADSQQRGLVGCDRIVSEFRKRLPDLLARDIRSISGNELGSVLLSMRRQNKAGAARAFRRHLHAFFSWARAERMAITANPLTGWRKGRATRDEKIKEVESTGRALSRDELKSVLRATPPDTSFNRLARFLILTGCRRGEGAGLLRDMLAGSTVLLPAWLTKQGREHAVYVTPALRSLLTGCFVDARHPNQMFPSSRTGRKMSGWARLFGKVSKLSEVKFTPHDLRRTFRTGLTDLGVEVGIAELAIGHAQPQLIRTYDKSTQETKVREAFAVWADYVESIVSELLAEEDETCMAA